MTDWKIESRKHLCGERSSFGEIPSPGSRVNNNSNGDGDGDQIIVLVGHEHGHGHRCRRRRMNNVV